jgi:predicted nucleic acid-binding protein
VIIRGKVQSLPTDATLYTSVISVGELLLDIQKAPREHKEKLGQKTQEMLDRFKAILEITRKVAETYGELVRIIDWLFLLFNPALQ